ncbi:MAG: hypothetical protein ACT6QM_06065 [Brevundimonas mediterranea]|uniref:hypothetical protein n=1 Tax=Brevundimonas mediterranea TaxID=74329 RepID=UPI004034AD53
MVQRVILGALGDGNYGLIVSKPGVAVSAGNPGQLLFDSRVPWARILTRGSTSFAVNQTSISVNVGVALNFVPIVHLMEAYPNDPGTFWRADNSFSFTVSGSSVTFSRSIATYAASMVYAIYSSRADA